jgi:hypothetical protein
LAKQKYSPTFLKKQPSELCKIWLARLLTLLDRFAKNRLERQMQSSLEGNKSSPKLWFLLDFPLISLSHFFSFILITMLMKTTTFSPRPLRMIACVAAIAATMIMTAPTAHAQQARFPQPSPGAKVMQTIGITDMTITYSRPGVKGREVWGKLVPFDQLWRTGANMATTLEFTDDVKIEGQKLAAGKYALFSIPGKAEWTLIFNKNVNQGGTAAYKQEEDALRVKVKPAAAAESHEWLDFHIENLSDNGAEVALYWEKLKVPFKVEVETKDLVLSKARGAVSWVPAMQFANYALQNNTNLDEAMKMIDVSIATQETYRNVLVKARLMEKTGAKKPDVLKMMEKAVALGKAQKDAPFDLADVEKQVAEMKAKK